MKKNTWTPFEIWVSVLTAAIIPLAAWLSVQLLHGLGTPFCLAAVFLIPAACTAHLVRVLKARKKRVLPAVLALTAAVIFLCAAINHIRFWAEHLYRLTGCYQPEAVAILLLYSLLLFDGALAGIGIGVYVSLPQGRSRSRTSRSNAFRRSGRTI